MVRQFNYITDGSHYFTLHLCGCKFNTILICLLYPSDAADEEDSVDLGGRRIHKKKIRNI